MTTATQAHFQQGSPLLATPEGCVWDPFLRDVDAAACITPLEATLWLGNLRETRDDPVLARLLRQRVEILIAENALQVQHSTIWTPPETKGRWEKQRVRVIPRDHFQYVITHLRMTDKYLRGLVSPVFPLYAPPDRVTDPATSAEPSETSRGKHFAEKRFEILAIAYEAAVGRHAELEQCGAIDDAGRALPVKFARFLHQEWHSVRGESAPTSAPPAIDRIRDVLAEARKVIRGATADSDAQKRA